MNPRIRTYSTEGLVPTRRVEYWNDTVGHHITPIETRPAEPRTFHARLDTCDCGFVTISAARSTPARNIHPEKLAARALERVFLLHVQQHGESVNSQDGRKTLLQKGDFTLCDSAREFDVSFRDPHHITIVRIPEKQLLRRLPHAGELTCVSMPADSGINGAVSGLITRFWSMCKVGMDPSMQERISTNILDLVATAYAELHEQVVAESSVVASRRLLIKEYIERNLCESKLSPCNIARRIGYSTSYVHHLFKGEKESITQYIIRRRLEEAAEMLANNAYLSRTISEIACTWGFNSLTHFGRAFKNLHGVTPREYRTKRAPVMN